MPHSLQRNVRRFLTLAIFFLLLTLAFWLGFELGSGERGLMGRAQFVVSPAQQAQLLKDCTDARARLESSRQALARERADRLEVEQARSIDAQALQDLREQVGRLEERRLVLDRQVSYLKRLVHEGDKGVVEITNFQLLPGTADQDFCYVFTARQMLPGFGRSQGAVGFKVRGQRGDEDVVLKLAALPSAQPRELTMDFEFFQEFSGELALPDDFTPDSVEIDIQPDSPLLLPNSIMIPWTVADEPCRSAATAEH